MHLCVVLPALNEEPIIAASCQKVVAFLASHFSGWTWEVVVADNGSTDQTAAVVNNLARQEPHLRYLAAPLAGKGNAIRSAWQSRAADAYCFMDADLATDLSALPALVAAVAHGGYDLAVGSRFAAGAVVKRDWPRRLTSHGYQLAVRLLFGTHLRDAPCGFKAITRRVRDELLSQVKNGAWFFDSELVILAERAGYRIAEIPVRWREPVTPGRVTKVKIWSLSLEYLRAMRELRRRLRTENIRRKEYGGSDR
jgi:glycosyltransferase involved in cell wall biosynthesis